MQLAICFLGHLEYIFVVQVGFKWLLQPSAMYFVVTAKLQKQKLFLIEKVHIFLFAMLYSLFKMYCHCVFN